MPPTTPPTQDPAPNPPSGHSSGVPLSRVFEIGKDVITIAVVPLALWIVNLSIDNALQTERIENLQGEVQTLRAEQAKVEKLRDELQALAIQQARVEGKVDTANARLDQIKSLLGGN